MRRQKLEPTHRLLEPQRQGGGGRTVTIVAASTMTKTTSGQGAKTTANAAAPPRGRGQRRHAIVMERAFVGLIFGTRSAPAASTLLPSRAPTTTTGSGRATTRRRAGGGQRISSIGAVGRQWRLAVARASGGGRDEQLKREGGV